MSKADRIIERGREILYDIDPLYTDEMLAVMTAVVRAIEEVDMECYREEDATVDIGSVPGSQDAWVDEVVLGGK
jgi:hypothetical protein